MTIKERVQEEDNKSRDSNYYVKVNKLESVLRPITAAVYIIFIIFTLVSLLNKRMNGKGYFINQGLQDILNYNTTSSWTYKYKVLDDLVEKFNYFYVDDKGTPNSNNKMTDSMIFMTNVNLNFVIIYN